MFSYIKEGGNFLFKLWIIKCQQIQAWSFIGIASERGKLSWNELLFMSRYFSLLSKRIDFLKALITLHGWVTECVMSIPESMICGRQHYCYIKLVSSAFPNCRCSLCHGNTSLPIKHNLLTTNFSKITFSTFLLF